MVRTKLIGCILLLLAGAMPSAWANGELSRKAAEHFESREWSDANICYKQLLRQYPTEPVYYVRAMIASVALGRVDQAAKHLDRSQQFGIPVDSIFKGVDFESRRLGDASLYEKLLLHTQARKSWLARVANLYLLDFYRYRKQPEHTIAVADRLLATTPDNLTIRKAKADALFESDKTEEAMALYKSILEQDSLQLDIVAVLGGYHRGLGKQALAFREAQMLLHDTIPGKVGEDDLLSLATTASLELLQAKAYYLYIDSIKSTPYTRSVLQDIDNRLATLDESDRSLRLRISKKLARLLEKK